MESKNLFHSEEPICAEHARDPDQNQGQESLLVELVEERVFKQLDKAHLWFSRYVEIAMDRDK